MTPRSLTRFSNPIYATPAANDALDMAGGARTPDGEQALFGLGCGNTRERSHLGVRELAAGECLSQTRQS